MKYYEEGSDYLKPILVDYGPFFSETPTWLQFFVALRQQKIPKLGADAEHSRNLDVELNETAWAL